MLTLSEPDPRRGDGDEGLVAPVKLIVSCGDSSEVFDTTKEALDQVAPLVEMSVKIALLGSVGARGNDRLCTAGRDGVDQGVAVVRFVGSNRVSGNAFKQRLGFVYVGHLSGCQTPAGEVAERFDQRMDFRSQPSARAADRLLAFFFWAPAAC